MSKKVEAFLVPKGPRLGGKGPINFWGITPDDGTEYGIYQCSCSPGMWVSPENALCPACGRQMTRIYGTKRHFVEKRFGEMESTGGMHEYICSSCGTPQYSNLGTDSFACIACGAKNTKVTAADVEAPQPTDDSQTESEAPAAKGGDVEYEPLADPSAFQGVTDADIQLYFYDDPDAGPFYNVDIKGQPVGRVELRRLPNADEVKDVFASNSYKTSIKNLIVSKGLQEAGKALNMKFWQKAANVDEIKASLDEEAHSKFEDYRARWFDRFGIALAGFDKNFWTVTEEGDSVPHYLKASFFQKIADLGYFNPETGEEEVASIVEDAWNDGAQRFFEAAISKTEDLMNLPDVEVETYRKLIGQVPVLIKE